MARPMRAPAGDDSHKFGMSAHLGSSIAPPIFHLGLFGPAMIYPGCFVHSACLCWLTLYLHVLGVGGDK